jgi:hypothetical protein
MSKPPLVLYDDSLACPPISVEKRHLFEALNISCGDSGAQRCLAGERQNFQSIASQQR